MKVIKRIEIVKWELPEYSLDKDINRLALHAKITADVDELETQTDMEAYLINELQNIWERRVKSGWNLQKSEVRFLHIEKIRLDVIEAKIFINLFTEDLNSKVLDDIDKAIRDLENVKKDVEIDVLDWKFVDYNIDKSTNKLAVYTKITTDVEKLEPRDLQRMEQRLLVNLQKIWADYVRSDWGIHRSKIISVRIKKIGTDDVDATILVDLFTEFLNDFITDEVAGAVSDVEEMIYA